MFDVTESKDRNFSAAASSAHNRLHHIAMIGNFPPRLCGIATFSADLYAALHSADPNLRCDVVAMNDEGGAYAYSDDVSLQIRQNEPRDYTNAANELNQANIELVCLQHEFGIFGGAAGVNLMALSAGVNAPIVTTLHTILENPNEDQRRVMDALVARSTRIVVMSRKGREIMTRVYGCPSRKIAVIPHGAPDRPLSDTAAMKRKLGYEGRDVVLTFGLLSPNKGIESVIRALPRVVAARPNLLYVVVGATHPHLVAREGEAYRDNLAALAKELGVTGNIEFVNAFVETDRLLDFLTAADVYVTPYLNKAQITSGTLAYAVALGKPVVSTPYWHAEELLAGGAGELIPFNDSDAIGDALTKLLGDDALRRAQSVRAYDRGRAAVWSEVGARYLEVFQDARAEWLAAQTTKARRTLPLPAMSLKAIERMTDSTGMLQHARFSVPDRAHGYCVDDNARALMLTQRLVAAGMQGPPIDRLANIYAAFVDHAWNGDTNRFRNFMGFDRSWLEPAGSGDSCGRTLWAIGETALHAKDPELKSWALWLGAHASAHLCALRAPRTMAFTALGLCALAEAGLPGARDRAYALLTQLLSVFDAERRPHWTWFEPVLGYDNARLCEALLCGATLFDSQDFRAAGLQSLDWLIAVQIAPTGRFRPVGHESFGARYTLPSQFDQQPLEATATVDACWAAFDLTQDQRWRNEAYRAFGWFMGENDLGVRMADPERGGCYDGLGADGANRNQGAESILSYQLALAAMRVRERPRRMASSF